MKVLTFMISLIVIQTAIFLSISAALHVGSSVTTLLPTENIVVPHSLTGGPNIVDLTKETLKRY